MKKLLFASASVAILAAVGFGIYLGIRYDMRQEREVERAERQIKLAAEYVEREAKRAEEKMRLLKEERKCAKLLKDAKNTMNFCAEVMAETYKTITDVPKVMEEMSGIAKGFRSAPSMWERLKEFRRFEKLFGQFIAAWEKMGLDVEAANKRVALEYKEVLGLELPERWKFKE